MQCHHRELNQGKTRNPTSDILRQKQDEEAMGEGTCERGPAQLNTNVKGREACDRRHVRLREGGLRELVEGSVVVSESTENRL
jgi:hypothetical protein